MEPRARNIQADSWLWKRIKKKKTHADEQFSKVSQNYEPCFTKAVGKVQPTSWIHPRHNETRTDWGVKKKNKCHADASSKIPSEIRYWKKSKAVPILFQAYSKIRYGLLPFWLQFSQRELEKTTAKRHDRPKTINVVQTAAVASHWLLPCRQQVAHRLKSSNMKGDEAMPREELGIPGSGEGENNRLRFMASEWLRKQQKREPVSMAWMTTMKLYQPVKMYGAACQSNIIKCSKKCPYQKLPRNYIQRWGVTNPLQEEPLVGGTTIYALRK